MNELNKRFFVLGLTLFLTACVNDQNFKVQFEPTLPVPFLIVPDDETQDSSNGYQENYQYPQDQRNYSYPQNQGDYQYPQNQEDYQYPEYQYDNNQQSGGY